MKKARFIIPALIILLVWFGTSLSQFIPIQSNPALTGTQLRQFLDSYFNGSRPIKPALLPGTKLNGLPLSSVTPAPGQCWGNVAGALSGINCSPAAVNNAPSQSGDYSAQGFGISNVDHLGMTVYHISALLALPGPTVGDMRTVDDWDGVPGLCSAHIGGTGNKHVTQALYDGAQWQCSLGAVVLGANSTVTVTSTATVTATVQVTATVTVTVTSTGTPTPSSTPTPTATPTPMLVGFKTCTIASGTTTQSLTCPTPVGLANNHLMVFIQSHGFGASPNCPVNTGWTLDTNFNDASGYQPACMYYRCANSEGTTETLTVNQSSGGGTSDGTLAAFGNTLCPTAPKDQTAGGGVGGGGVNHGFGATGAYPALPGSTANQYTLVVHGLAINGTATVSATTPAGDNTAGFSIGASNTNATMLSYYVDLTGPGTAIGSKTTTFNTASTNYSVMTGSFKGIQ